MNEETQIIRKAFSPWKVYLAIGIGIAIIGGMLFHNLNKPYFVYDPGNGTHSSIYSPNEKEIDPTNVHQFIKTQNGDYRQQQLIDLIREMDWTTHSALWIFMAVCCMVGRDFFYMVRIRTLTKKDLSWRQSFHVILLWEFASALSPGVVGGSTVAMFILKKEKIDLGRSTAIVMITALMDNLFFLLMVPIVLLSLGNHGELTHGMIGENSILWMFWIAYFGVLATSLILLTGIFFYPQLIKKLLLLPFQLSFLSKWEDKAKSIGNEIVLTSKIIRQENFSFWVKVGGSTFLSWISRYLVINCLVAAFVSLSFSEHLLILGKQFILWIIMLVSPTPGGSGIAEFAFGRIIHGMGASALLLTGIAALWRLMTYFPYLLIGAIILPKWLRKK